jgi:hypothetical protein
MGEVIEMDWLNANGYAFSVDDAVSFENQPVHF